MIRLIFNSTVLSVAPKNRIDIIIKYYNEYKKKAEACDSVVIQDDEKGRIIGSYLVGLHGCPMEFIGKELKALIKKYGKGIELDHE